MLKSMHENERTMIQLRLFNYKFRAPFTSSQPPSHDENLILCGIMGPKLANVRNIHFACSSSQYRFPFASQHNYLCICNSSFVSLCKKKKKIRADPDSGHSCIFHSIGSTGPWSQWAWNVCPLNTCRAEQYRVISSVL